MVEVLVEVPAHEEGASVRIPWPPTPRPVRGDPWSAHWGRRGSRRRVGVDPSRVQGCLFDGVSLFLVVPVHTRTPPVVSEWLQETQLTPLLVVLPGPEGHLPSLPLQASDHGPSVPAGLSPGRVVRVAVPSRPGPPFRPRPCHDRGSRRALTGGHCGQVRTRSRTETRGTGPG